MLSYFVGERCVVPHNVYLELRDAMINIVDLPMYSYEAKEMVVPFKCIFKICEKRKLNIYVIAK